MLTDFKISQLRRLEEEESKEERKEKKAMMVEVGGEVKVEGEGENTEKVLFWGRAICGWKGEGEEDMSLEIGFFSLIPFCQKLF